MTGPGGDRAVALCARLYALLLAAYPADFRRDYGPQMARDVRACCRDAHRRRGARGVLGVFVVALGDLILSACAERRAYIKALLSGDKTRRWTLPMAIPTAETTDAAATGRGRMRAAIVVDLAVGVVTLPAFVFCLTQLNALLWIVAPGTRWRVTWLSMLLMSAVTLALGGAAVALLARLAARGQTPGLAVVRLRWGAGAGRAARRRLLGEPQFWCAALPVAYLLFAFVVGTLQSIARLAWPDDALAARFYSAMGDVGALGGPALVLGALACVIASRRRPGRLVSRA